MIKLIIRKIVQLVLRRTSDEKIREIGNNIIDNIIENRKEIEDLILTNITDSKKVTRTKVEVEVIKSNKYKMYENAFKILQ